jgi:putative SOS response-associated peptidase YedK
MCGRVRLSSDVSEIKLVFSIPPHRPTPNFPPSWNVAPTDPLPIVRFDAKAGERSLDLARWGLVPYWAKDIKVGFANINAKAEGIENRPAFREAFQRRRCLVPVDNFYEWKKTATGKQPYAIALADRGLMALAGLWENWRSTSGEWVRSFAIVTTEPNALCAELHNRMPVFSALRRGPHGSGGACRCAPAQRPPRALPVGRNDMLAGQHPRRQREEQ